MTVIGSSSGADRKATVKPLPSTASLLTPGEVSPDSCYSAVGDEALMSLSGVATTGPAVVPALGRTVR